MRVNAIAPGWIDTPMNERHALRPDGTLDLDKKREYVETRGSKISPMGIPGEPDDIAFAALYLASPAAKFVTGIVDAPQRRLHDALVERPDRVLTLTAPARRRRIA